MASIKITNMGQWDGTYDLGDKDRAFNVREWRWIKTISGYMPATIATGFAGQDPDLFVALAVIAMCRNRKFPRDNWQSVADDLAEQPYTGNSIDLIGDEVEEEEIPPTSASGNGASSPTDSRSSSDTPTPKESSSGTTSPTSSERLAATP